MGFVWTGLPVHAGGQCVLYTTTPAMGSMPHWCFRTRVGVNLGVGPWMIAGRATPLHTFKTLEKSKRDLVPALNVVNVQPVVGKIEHRIFFGHYFFSLFSFRIFLTTHPFLAMVGPYGSRAADSQFRCGGVRRLREPSIRYW